MKLLLPFLLLSVQSFAQLDMPTYADTFADRIDSLIKYDVLTGFEFPERSMQGGSVHGYYLDGRLLAIYAYNPVSFYWNRQNVYFDEQGTLLKAEFDEHMPQEEPFFETLPEEFDADTVDWSRMEYDDTLYVFYFQPKPFVEVYGEGEFTRRTNDSTLIELRLRMIDSMVAQLTHWRVLDWDTSRTIEGDFSFTKEWDYPMGVYVNQWGQVSCDGFCPERAWDMKVDGGRIPEDSLEVFYQIVDTTHQYHSLLSEFSQYELFDSDYLDFRKTDYGGVIGTSRCDAGNHSSLNIEIDSRHFYAWVDYTSITNGVPQRFELSKGTLTLDDKLLEQGIYKGSFDFEFANTLDPAVPLTWKGIFYNELKE